MRRTATANSSDHPLVGTWIVDVNTQDMEDPPALLTIGDDGTLRLTDCCNGPGAGVWAPSSTRTADATVMLPWYDDDGFVGYNTIRGDVVVSSDGDSLTATYTMDIPARDGTTTGQLGPVTATGTRMTVEPIGEPVGPLPVAVPDLQRRHRRRPRPRPTDGRIIRPQTGCEVSGRRSAVSVTGGPNHVVSASLIPDLVRSPPRPHIRLAESERRWER